MPNDTLLISKTGTYTRHKITRSDINNAVACFTLIPHYVKNAIGQHNSLSEDDYRSLEWQKGLRKQLENNGVKIKTGKYHQDNSRYIKRLSGHTYNKHNLITRTWFFDMLEPVAGHFLCKKGLKCSVCWKAFNRFLRLMMTRVAMTGVATPEDKRLDDITLSYQGAAIRIMWVKNKYKVVALRTGSVKKSKNKPAGKRRKE